MPKNVSIIIPHFNNNKNLQNLVNSILKQSEFTKKDELLIIDDNSKIKPYFKNSKLIKIYYHKNNLGPSASRNTGIRKAKNEILFFLDSDTELLSNGLKKIKNHFNHKKNEKILNGYCHYNPINSNWFTKYKGINEHLWGIKQITNNGYKIFNTRVGAIEKKLIKKKKILFDKKIRTASSEDYKFSHY